MGTYRKPREEWRGFIVGQPKLVDGCDKVQSANDPGKVDKNSGTINIKTICC
jgi:hypothetical protein